tara:strand:- start:726 stop:2336 length:1611 start_codon:yes stop_codon:yes gene_type:complete
MKNLISKEIQQTLITLNYYSDDLNIHITVPKNKEFGDLSTNIAFLLSKKINKNPIEIATKIKDSLQELTIFKEINIAGAGFLNFKINPNSIVNYLNEIIKLNSNYGKSQKNNKKVLVEFVSANPTGPLTVGHGRGAILGDTLSNVFEWNGYQVQREYYYNNAGRQMRILGESVKARYLDSIGLNGDFPDDGYQGDYIYEIANDLIKDHKKTLCDRNTIFKKTAEEYIFKNIKNTLKNIGIEFDTFFNENTLYKNKEIYKIIDQLDAKGLIYNKDEAVWFAGNKVGRENDRVLIKKTGEPTYRLPDMAYHVNKMQRGYDLCIDIFGADHMDAYPDVLEVVKQLGFDSSKIKVIIHQFISILKSGKQVKMSTRKATYITLDELIEQVGSDVVRYFFIMRGINSHLNFDLDIAKEKSDKNPIYYIQYANARINTILNTNNIKLENYNLSLLNQDSEIKLIYKLIEFKETLKKVEKIMEPQILANYLLELSSMFHKYYSKNRIINDDIELTKTRLIFIKSISIVITNGLNILGISAPERM